MSGIFLIIMYVDKISVPCLFKIHFTAFKLKVFYCTLLHRTKLPCYVKLLAQVYISLSALIKFTQVWFSYHIFPKIGSYMSKEQNIFFILVGVESGDLKETFIKGLY